MGNGVTAEKEKEFEQERKLSIKTINEKYKMLERRKCLIIGGP